MLRLQTPGRANTLVTLPLTAEPRRAGPKACLPCRDNPDRPNERAREAARRLVAQWNLVVWSDPDGAGVWAGWHGARAGRGRARLTAPRCGPCRRGPRGCWILRRPLLVDGRGWVGAGREGGATGGGEGLRARGGVCGSAVRALASSASSCAGAHAFEQSGSSERGSLASEAR